MYHEHNQHILFITYNLVNRYRHHYCCHFLSHFTVSASSQPFLSFHYRRYHNYHPFHHCHLRLNQHNHHRHMRHQHHIFHNLQYITTLLTHHFHQLLAIINKRF